MAHVSAGFVAATWKTMDFSNIRKNQKLSYTHSKGSTTYKLMFKRIVMLGAVQTLFCKVMGKHYWYKEVYLTTNDFELRRARLR